MSDHPLTVEEDIDVSLEGEGEIEILDESTGEVIGMTDEVPQASQVNLKRLTPSPYGDAFGSFG